MEEITERIIELVEDIKLALDIDDVLDEDFDLFYIEEQVRRLKELWLQKYDQ